MKLYTACVIGCIGLFFAGIACLFIGVNPGFMRQPAPPDGGAIEERIPPSPREATETPEKPEKEDEEKPVEAKELRGQSPSR
jgi:hypothetical protein